MIYELFYACVTLWQQIHLRMCSGYILVNFTYFLHKQAKSHFQSHNQINTYINFNTQINIFLQMEQMVFVVVHQLFFLPNFFLTKRGFDKWLWKNYNVEERWLLMQRKKVLLLPASFTAIRLTQCHVSSIHKSRILKDLALFKVSDLEFFSNPFQILLPNFLQIWVASDTMILTFRNLHISCIPSLFWPWLSPPNHAAMVILCKSASQHPILGLASLTLFQCP